MCDLRGDLGDRLEPVTGSSQSSIPAGSSAAQRRDAPPSTDQAPLASSRIAICRPGGGPHRGQPPGVVADPDLDLDTAEPGRRGPRPRRGRAGTVGGRDRRVDRDRAAGRAPPSSRHTGSPARRPARSHSARSMAASAWGSTATRAQRGQQLRVRAGVGAVGQHGAAVLERRQHVIDADPVIGRAAAPPRRSRRADPGRESSSVAPSSKRRARSECSPDAPSDRTVARKPRRSPSIRIARALTGSAAARPRAACRRRAGASRSGPAPG